MYGSNPFDSVSEIILEKVSRRQQIMEKYLACKELLYFHLSFIKVYTSWASSQEITILLHVLNKGAGRLMLICSLVQNCINACSER